MHYRVEHFRGFVQVECLWPYFWEGVGTGVIMLHVVFTTPSTKGCCCSSFIICCMYILGPQTLVREVLTSYRGRRKGQMMGTNWKRWKGN